MDNLESATSHQVRPLHPEYTKVIKDRFTQFPNQTYQMLLVMVNTVKKEEFREANVSIPKYNILLAKKQRLFIINILSIKIEKSPSHAFCQILGFVVTNQELFLFSSYREYFSQFHVFQDLLQL